MRNADRTRSMMGRYPLHVAAVAISLAACSGDLGPSGHPDRPTTGTIQAGGVLVFETDESVSTLSHIVGDTFALVLRYSAADPTGSVLAAGTPAQGMVTYARKGEGPYDPSLLGIGVTSIEVGAHRWPIEGQVQSAFLQGAAQPPKGAVGTAIGVGVVVINRGGMASFPRGSQLVVRLGRDLVF